MAKRELIVQQKQGNDDSRKHEDIFKNGDDAGGEQFVQGVDIRCDARHQAADRIFVEKGDIELLKMPKDLHAEIAHDLLAH